MITFKIIVLIFLKHKSTSLTDAKKDDGKGYHEKKLSLFFKFIT